MFRRASKRQVLWPVIVRVPAEDGSGTIVEQHCKLQYELISEKQWQAMAAMSDQEAADEMVLRIKGWEDIEDEPESEGQPAKPFSFNETNLRALLADDFFAKAATIGLWQASQGAPAKNS